MNITISHKNKKELFNNYLLGLNFILKLRVETELPLLASFLCLHHTHFDYDPTVLSSLLFSSDTKTFIRKNLGVSESSFNKSFKKLKEKQMIIGDKINPKLTQYPKEGDIFKISIKFIEEEIKK